MKDRIIINNAANVEDYLGLDPRGGKHLRYLELRKNRYIKGVRELLERIPSGYDMDEMDRFYEDTGLILRIELFNSEWEFEQFDRHGKYPHPGLRIGSPMLSLLQDHPEWLDSQEDADIIIRYVEPIKKELRRPLRKRKLFY